MPRALAAALRRVGIVGLMAMLAVACTSPSRRAALEAMPEAGLLYPGAELLADGGHGASFNIDGESPAAIWAIYGTSDNSDAVIAWHKEQLRAADWQSVGGIPTTSELEALSWRREEVGFRLGIMDVAEWHERIEGSDRYPVMFEVRLVDGQDPGER